MDLQGCSHSHIRSGYPARVQRSPSFQHSGHYRLGRRRCLRHDTPQTRSKLDSERRGRIRLHPSEPAAPAPGENVSCHDQVAPICPEPGLPLRTKEGRNMLQQGHVHFRLRMHQCGRFPQAISAQDLLHCSTRENSSRDLQRFRPPLLRSHPASHLSGEHHRTARHNRDLQLVHVPLFLFESLPRQTDAQGPTHLRADPEILQTGIPILLRRLRRTFHDQWPIPPIPTLLPPPKPTRLQAIHHRVSRSRTNPTGEHRLQFRGLITRLHILHTFISYIQ